MEMWIRSDLGWDLVVCCCECGDELSGYIKIGNYWLAKQLLACQGRLL